MNTVNVINIMPGHKYWLSECVVLSVGLYIEKSLLVGKETPSKIAESSDCTAAAILSVAVDYWQR